MGAKRRWGYLIWAVAGGVIGVPEITAAVDNGALPFTTISEMTGHLERRFNWVELLVVAVIVFVAFSTVRVRPRSRAGGTGGDAQLDRTPGGRLTVQPAAPSAEFDEEDAPGLFLLAAIGSSVAAALGTVAAIHWWDDPNHFHPAYVLYGSLAFFWLVIPSILAFGWGKDFPFPTLFQTVSNLEEWLRSRSWPHRLGPIAGWFVAYVLLWGLVVLLLHLTLYPYPDITRILNPGG